MGKATIRFGLSVRARNFYFEGSRRRLAIASTSLTIVRPNTVTAVGPFLANSLIWPHLVSTAIRSSDRVAGAQYNDRFWVKELR